MGDSEHYLKNGIINRKKGELFWEAPNNDFPLVEMSVLCQTQRQGREETDEDARDQAQHPHLQTEKKGDERALLAH